MRTQTRSIRSWGHRRAGGPYAAAAESEEDAERREDDSEEDLQERAAVAARHGGAGGADRIGIGAEVGDLFPALLPPGARLASGLSTFSWSGREAMGSCGWLFPAPTRFLGRWRRNGPPLVGSGPSRTVAIPCFPSDTSLSFSNFHLISSWEKKQ